MVERSDPAAGDPPAGWTALIRGPHGLTVVRPVGSATDGRWRALYSGDTAHGLDVPGMLSALLGPLAAAGISVFVISTYEADLVLVPEAELGAATDALSAAGHRVHVPSDAGDQR